MSHFLDEHDGLGLAELIRDGELSATEVFDATLERVDERNPAVNAVVHRMDDEARRSIEAGLPGGPFTGVPFLLKDLLADYAGVPTSHGSRYYADYTPDHDSELTSRYKAAGLVIFGKTNTPEFGGSVTTEPQLHGPTANPWDLTRSAGGSSGGSGAAVGSRMVAMAHGNDGGGSLRIPGSVNGAFAMKPTRGRLPTGPDAGEFWNGLVEQHAITRSVRDSAALLDATCGPDSGAPYRAAPPARPYLDEVGADPGRLRIAYSAVPGSGDPIDPACVTALMEAVELLADLGHEVVEATPTYDAATMGEALVTVIAANYLQVVTDRERMLGRPPRPDELERVIWYRIEMAKEFGVLRLADATRGLHLAGRQFNTFFEDHDVYLNPTLAKPPQPLGTFDMNSEDVEGYLGKLYGYIPFTTVYNATGNPACTIPTHWSDDGLPIGVHAGAAMNGEATLFRLASQLEAARPWSHRIPPIFGGS